MKPIDRIVAGLVVSLTVFAILYFVEPTAPKYYPVDHEWRWFAKAPGPAMAWYGRSGLALAGAFIAAIVSYPISKRIRTNFSARVVNALSIYLLVLLLASMSIIVYEQRGWFRAAPTPTAVEYR